MIRYLNCAALAAAVIFSVSTPTGLAETSSQPQTSAGFQVEPVQLQKALASAGFYKGTIDGIAGRRTKASLRAFQQANGLSADGICGPKTWSKLKTFLPEEATSETGTLQELPADELDAAPASSEEEIRN